MQKNPEQAGPASGSFGDTIAAISTPPGRGGIGIVRLSGPAARRIGEELVRLDRPLEPGRARLGVVPDFSSPEPSTANGILDEVVVTYFAGPRSYTGEDVVEIAAHGSPVVLAAILHEMLRQGARMAEPGEFTQRAFLSGRLDLTQAEAVHDLIAATTLHQARVAASQIGGSVSAVVAPIKEQLLGLIALLEAGIDFAEDDLELAPVEQLDETLRQIVQPLGQLASSFGYGRTLREGFTLALVGRPNAGKSSLFNALLERDRAIVTATPGTTRDLITERLTFQGIPAELTDTAGLRQSTDEAETLGIARTYTAISEAALTLLVVDLTQGLHPDDLAVLSNASPSSDTGNASQRTDLSRSSAATAANRRVLIVANKTDALTNEAQLQLAIDRIRAAVNEPVIAVSARTGHGVRALRAAITDLLTRDLPEQDTVVITSMRQHAALTAASEHLQHAQAALQQSWPQELLLLDLHEALHSLDELTGTTTADDILSRIFSTFCIGK